MERKSPLFMLIIISFFAIGCGNSARIRLNQIIEITSTIFPKATSFGEAYSKEKFLSINQILSIKEYSFLETKISSGNKKNESSSVVFPLHKSNDYFITTKSTRELLQGKWQSMDDSSNFLIFNSNQRKEISNGMNTWEIESYVLSDKCKNDTDIETISESEKDKYISCIESDMCWYIVSIDAKILELSYVGRGNTLKYKRVNQQL